MHVQNVTLDMHVATVANIRGLNIFFHPSAEPFAKSFGYKSNNTRTHVPPEPEDTPRDCYKVYFHKVELVLQYRLLSSRITLHFKLSGLLHYVTRWAYISD